MKWLSMLLMSLCLTSCNISNPSNGHKIGRIVKLADEGVWCKTCEGELIRGGLVDGSGSMGSSFKFTIESRALREIALQAFETQAEVILTYEVELCSACWRSECSTPHFVKAIEIVR